MSEIYQGQKFEFKQGKTAAPAHAELSDLKKYCAIFNKNNFAPVFEGGSSGNLSFRTQKHSNHFIITCGHTALRKNMPDSDFARVTQANLPENKIYADCLRPPSSESLLHAEIYKQKPTINAVFHGHSQLFITQAPRMGIPVTKKEQDYGTPELVHEVLDSIKDHRFIIMKNHGFISLGETMKDAMEQIQMIYKKIK